MGFIKERKDYVEEVTRVPKSEGFFLIQTYILPAKHGLDLDALEGMMKNNLRYYEFKNI